MTNPKTYMNNFWHTAIPGAIGGLIVGAGFVLGGAPLIIIIPVSVSFGVVLGAGAMIVTSIAESTGSAQANGDVSETISFEDGDPVHGGTSISDGGELGAGSLSGQVGDETEQSTATEGPDSSEFGGSDDGHDASGAGFDPAGMIITPTDGPGGTQMGPTIGDEQIHQIDGGSHDDPDPDTL